MVQFGYSIKTITSKHKWTIGKLMGVENQTLSSLPFKAILASFNGNTIQTHTPKVNSNTLTLMQKHEVN